LKGDMTNDDYSSLRDFICEGDASRIFVGDHLESASPSDPSFWSIHPTQERLFQAKLLVHAFTDLTTSAWPTDAQAEYVCDKSQCYQADSGRKDYFEDCCYGHYEYDQLLDFTSADRSKKIGPTNHEILRNTDLSRPDYGMNYVYDNFQWSHCDGFDFDSKLTQLYSASSGMPMTTPNSGNGGSSSSSGGSSKPAPSSGNGNKPSSSK